MATTAENRGLDDDLLERVGEAGRLTPLARERVAKLVKWRILRRCDLAGSHRPPSQSEGRRGLVPDVPVASRGFPTIDGCRGSDARSLRLMLMPPSGVGSGIVRREGLLDPPGERVDQLGELGDGLERAVLAPAGDIGTVSPETSSPRPPRTTSVVVSTITSACAREYRW